MKYLNSFNFYLEQRTGTSANVPDHLAGWVPIGGFVPGETQATYLHPEEHYGLHEAEGEGFIGYSVPRSRVLFDEDTYKFLNQFPIPYQNIALSLYYGRLLLGAAKKIEAGEEVPDRQDIILHLKRGKWALFKDIETNIAKQVKKLSTPRDMQALRDSNGPDVESGLHGFNLTEGLTVDPEKDFVSTVNYRAFNEQTAGKKLSEIREAILQGWNWTADNAHLKKAMQIGAASAGGGPAPKGFLVRYNGQVLDRSGRLNPVGSDDPEGRYQFMLGQTNNTNPIDILNSYYMGEGFGDHHKIISSVDWSRKEVSTPKTMFLPGRLIPQQAIKKYNEMLDAMKQEFQGFKNGEPVWANKSVADSMLEEMTQILPTSGHQNETKSVGEWEFAAAAAGNPNVKLGNDAESTGGFMPNIGAEVSPTDNPEDRELLAKFLVAAEGSAEGRANRGQGALVINPVSGQMEKSPMQETLWNSIHDSGKYNDDHIIVMRTLFHDIFQGAYMTLMNRAGRPEFQDLLEAYRSKDKKKIASTYKVALARAKKIASEYGHRFAQLEIGHVPRRRQRGKTGDLRSLDAPTTKGTSQGSMHDVDATKIGGTRGVGQRVLFKTADPVTLADDLLGRIRNLVSERRQAKMDQDKLTKNIKADGTMRMELLQTLYNQFIDAQERHGIDLSNPQIELAAMQWAGDKLEQLLAGKKIEDIEVPEPVTGGTSDFGKGNDVEGLESKLEDMFGFDVVQRMVDDPKTLQQMKASLNSLPNGERKDALVFAVQRAEEKLGVTKAAKPMAPGKIAPEQIKFDPNELAKKVSHPDFIRLLASNPKAMIGAEQAAKQLNHPALMAAIAKAKESMRKTAANESKIQKMAI